MKCYSEITIIYAFTTWRTGNNDRRWVIVGVTIPAVLS
jgi:hypothetical protein